MEVKEAKANGNGSVVLLTYNNVAGFGPGVHAEGKLIVYSWKRQEGNRTRSPDIAKDITDSFYDDFDLRKESDLIKHVFVYTGLNAVDESIQAARMIGHDIKRPGEKSKIVTMVGCHCNYERKKSAAYNSYSVNLIACDCGGKDTMGRIAEHILKGIEPDMIGDYGKLKG